MDRGYTVGQHYDIGLKMTHSRLIIYPPILILEYLLNTKPKKLCRYLNQKGRNATLKLGLSNYLEQTVVAKLTMIIQRFCIFYSKMSDSKKFHKVPQHLTMIICLHIMLVTTYKNSISGYLRVFEIFIISVPYHTLYPQIYIFLYIEIFLMHIFLYKFFKLIRLL